MATFNYNGYFVAFGSSTFTPATLSIETSGADASYQYAYTGDSPGTPYFSGAPMHAGIYTGATDFTLDNGSETVSFDTSNVIHSQIIDYASAFESQSIVYVLQTTTGYYHFALSGQELTDSIMAVYDSYLDASPVFGGLFGEELGFLLSETDYIVGEPAEPLTVIGTTADENLVGGALDDEIYGGGGEDTLTGGAGNDLLDAAEDPAFSGNDTFFGGDGNDTIIASDAGSEIYGGAGADYVDATAGDNDLVSYEDSDASIYVHLGTGTISGGDAEGDTLLGVEDIIGSAFADAIYMNAQANYVDGEAGNDFIAGQGGDDLLFGWAGDDTLIGGSGQDLMYGEAGTDKLVGGLGNDDLYGGDGNDRLIGGDGNDDINGGAGNDVLVAGDGGDSLFGGEGDDVLRGGAGNDFLRAAEGTNRMFGEADDDVLVGGDDRDIMFGGDGNDTLVNSFGDDLMRGGAGEDVFEFASNFLIPVVGTAADGGPSVDRIFDFVQGEDTIDIYGYFSISDYDELTALMSNNNFGLRIDLDPTTAVFIKDMDMDTIAETDFNITPSDIFFELH